MRPALATTLAASTEVESDVSLVCWLSSDDFTVSDVWEEEPPLEVVEVLEAVVVPEVKVGFGAFEQALKLTSTSADTRKRVVFFMKLV